MTVSQDEFSKYFNGLSHLEHLSGFSLSGRTWRWALAFGLALWGFAFVFADGYLYGSRTGKLETRIFQFAWAGGGILWLSRPRSRTAMEAWLLSGGGVMMVLSALSLAQLAADQLVFAVISRLFGLFFIIHLLQLRWPAALAAFVIAGATMLGGYAANQIDGVHRIGLASMWVLAPVPILTYGAWRRENFQRESFRLRRDIVIANARLASEIATRTRLFFGLSHDLRTPLTVVRGEADRLRSASEAATRASHAARIDAQIDYATDLVDQLLELARLDEGTAHGQPAAVRIDRIAAELAAQLQPPAGISINVGGMPAVALADPRHVRRILTNLISNALRHVDPTQGRIDLIVSEAPAAGQVEVEVRDDGPGIDAALASRLFERFATMAPGGAVVSGVGLPLARELAELNGGALELRGVQPASFVLRLQRATTEVAEDAVDDGSVAVARDVLMSNHAAATATNSRHRADAPGVLVVEDHATLAMLLTDQLEPELAVTVAKSLADARAAMARKRFDVIVADIGLPDGSGLELLSDIRASDTPKPAFIVLSALGDPATRAQTISAGADDHLVKPYAAAELRARIEKVLRQARERELALERQRDEVLAEIHDGVGGALARAVAKVRALPDATSGDVSPLDIKTPQILSDMRDSVLTELAAATEELRNGLRLLTETDCVWNAVVADIRFSLATIAETHGIDFHGDCGRSDVTLRPVVAHTLRRIATEAMTNVVKHSGARSVRFEATCDGHGIRMKLRDDGCGLLSGAVGGFGLGIMKARAARLGGEVDFQAADEGQGAVLSLHLPCAAHHPAQP